MSLSNCFEFLFRTATADKGHEKRSLAEAVGPAESELETPQVKRVARRQSRLSATPAEATPGTPDPTTPAPQMKTPKNDLPTQKKDSAVKERQSLGTPSETGGSLRTRPCDKAACLRAGFKPRCFAYATNKYVFTQ